MYFFIVETKGRTLEETAALFDGEEAAAELQEAAAGHRVVDEKTSGSFHEEKA